MHSGPLLLEEPIRMASILEPSKPSFFPAMTKIVGTLGPNSRSLEIISACLNAGMSVARFDFSWGDAEFHQETLDTLKMAIKSTKKLCAVMLDTVGPELQVVNKTERPISLEAESFVVLTPDQTKEANSNLLPINFHGLSKAVKSGDTIFIGQYLFTGSETTSVWLEVSELKGEDVVCLVKNSATLSGPLYTLHVSQIHIDRPTLTEKDKEVIKTWGARNNIDFLTLSYTRHAEDIREAREFLSNHCDLQQTQIFAKIENIEGLTHFDEILQEADGIILSRGNLGIDLPPEKVVAKMEGRSRKRDVLLSKLYSFGCIKPSFNEEHSQIGQRGYARVVHCNDPDNPEAIQLNYRGNYVSTTKYTAVNFIPKSLFEQFRRVANLYFLIVACVSFSPLAPYAAVSIAFPLAVVVGATMAKEAVEDWRRKKQDIEANNRQVELFDGSNQIFVKSKWKELRVGDVVKVYKDEHFPADLLFLSSNYEDGICYVETSNLDGETNLKLKHALEVTSCLQDESSLCQFKALTKCEDPNENLYSFVGTLYYNGKQYPLSLQQLLLRDSKLWNTDHIYGVVVFTGHDTKVMQNAINPPSKRSGIEKRLDKVIYILFSFVIVISFTGSVFFGITTKKDIYDGKLRRWYLRPDKVTVLFDPKRAALAAFLHLLTDLMLYGYLVPISLYISIEIVKVLQCIFINQDQHMYCEETDRPAHARTSNLNEELGQVHTILSDKTGTLTCNSMEFVKCSIAGISYGQGMTEVEAALAKRQGQLIPPGALGAGSVHNTSDKPAKAFNINDERLMNGRWVKEPHSDMIQKFFRVLAICHTAIPDVHEETGQISYEAESPDEAALVISAKELGFEFFRRTQTSIFLHELDHETGQMIDRVYELLHVLEFSSSRKRMSVIVRNEEKTLLLLCKGADSVMLERLSEEGRQFEAEVKAHIKKYAEAGLRTLVVSYRKLKEEEFAKWEEEFQNAKTSVSADRDALVDAAADKIEKQLILLGATALEDKLQKGVPECIEKLAQAGISIWVLTGDKMETAINIGYACSLLRQGMKQIVISLDSPEIISLERRGDKEAIAKASLDSVRKQLGDAKSQIRIAKSQNRDAKDTRTEFGLIIDGKSLAYALDKNLEISFLDVATGCDSVICCRSSPKQKALVTRLVKIRTGKTTLAIGDGANDVGMIQEANIGVGISGVEGMQAAMSSDVNIAQFRFLERLLLLHGHWCYRRISTMICYFFYKNITFGLTLFWFETHSSFSAQPAYNDWYLSTYNVFFTSLPVIALGVFDQDVSARLCLKNPDLYAEGIENILYSWPRILGWMFNGLCSSMIIFFLTTSSLKHHAFRSDGRVVDFSVLAATMYSCVVWTVNCQMALSINYFTWIQHFVIWGSIALWYIFLLIYGTLPPTFSKSAYLILVEVCAPSPLYWIIIVFVVFSTLLPYFAFRAIQLRFWPMPHDVVQLDRNRGTGGDVSNGT